MERIAFIPGSFDPVTRGHVDIIRRAALLFDKVIVAVTVNAAKNSGMFCWGERLEILKCAVRNIENVECLLCDTLASDFAKEHGARWYVKGVRNATDFDYEYSLANITKHFDDDLETVLLPAEPTLAHISSTYARERIRFGCELDDIADSETAALIRKIYMSKK